MTAERILAHALAGGKMNHGQISLSLILTLSMGTQS